VKNIHPRSQLCLPHFHRSSACSHADTERLLVAPAYSIAAASRDFRKTLVSWGNGTFLLQSFSDLPLSCCPSVCYTKTCREREIYSECCRENYRLLTIVCRAKADLLHFQVFVSSLAFQFIHSTGLQYRIAIAKWRS
jgi:hypothetical protein